MSIYGRISQIALAGMITTLLLLLHFALADGAGGRNPPTPSARFKIQTLEANLQNNNFDQMDVLYFPEDTETVASITPEYLEAHYLYKFTVFHVSESNKQKSLSLALKAMHPQLSPEQTADFRWGCHFYHNGKLVSTLYMDRDGSGVMIDGDLFLASPSLKKWFKANFASAFQ